jgi:hypothetical protein
MSEYSSRTATSSSGTVATDETSELIACLIPAFDGAIFSVEWKDALWARFFMEAPRRRRRSVERYSIVKRA